MNLEDSYKNIASAVINQAIKDYKQTFKLVESEKVQVRIHAICEMKDIEDFATTNRIDLYCILSGIDKSWVIKKLKEIKDSKGGTFGRYERILK